MIGAHVEGAHVVVQPVPTRQLTTHAPGTAWQRSAFAEHVSASSFVQSTVVGTQLFEHVVVQPVPTRQLTRQPFAS